MMTPFIYMKAVLQKKKELRHKVVCFMSIPRIIIDLFIHQAIDKNNNCINLFIS